MNARSDGDNIDRNRTFCLIYFFPYRSIFKKSNSWVTNFFTGPSDLEISKFYYIYIYYLFHM